MKPQQNDGIDHRERLSRKSRSPWPTIIVTALLVAGIQQALYEHAVNALANPITSARNRRQVITQTAARVVATGQKCNIVVCNVDVGMSQFPLYHGGLQPDGGVITSVEGIPICDNTVTGFTKCAGLCFSYDITPDGIYLVAGTAMPDGGIAARIMEGTGCTQP